MKTSTSRPNATSVWVWVSECTREINKKKEFSTRFLRRFEQLFGSGAFFCASFSSFHSSHSLIRTQCAFFFFVFLHPVHYCFSWLYQKTDCRGMHHVAIDMLWNVQSTVVNDSKDQIKRHAVEAVRRYAVAQESTGFIYLLWFSPFLKTFTSHSVHTFGRDWAAIIACRI